MQTDPISAAVGYRRALEAIREAASLAEARRHAARALAITVAPPQAADIHISSGYGGNSGQPFVTIALSAPAVQFVVPQARDIGLQLFAAADAAESDAFLIRFVTEKVHADPAAAASVLAEFRAFRDQRRKEAP
jgi:hypothetical protein